MKVSEIINGNNKGIEYLKERRMYPFPNVTDGLKAINPKLHDIMDETKRPNKVVVTTDAEGNEIRKIEKVARIPLALQQLIINRSVSFMFGNKVQYESDADTRGEVDAFKLYKNTLSNAKCKSLNRKVGRSLAMFGEVAEYWYIAEGGNLGINKDKKLRVSLFTPDKCKMYPFFDNNGDMVAFSREFTEKEEETTHTYFETYTDEEYIKWDENNTIVEHKMHKLGKIPIVYANNGKRETEDIDILVDRLEKLLSNFADTNDYHASPKIVVDGNIKRMSKKGESGAILEVDTGTHPYYLEWNSAPQAIQLEIETLLSMIYDLTQTPNISFDNMKGIGNLSGVALRLMFMDAHLKVQDKCEVMDEYLQRRTSIVCTYLSALESEFANAIKNIEITHTIVPYMSTSDTEDINALLSVNGNKPLMSHRASVLKANLVKNPEDDYEQIKEEENQSALRDITEPSY